MSKVNAYVIMMNDAPVFVVIGSETYARAKMIALRAAHMQQHCISGGIYCAYWRVREVPYNCEVVCEKLPA